jgi:hypothetical protein
MPTIIIPPDREVLVGEIDHSDHDLSSAFGGYANHIGFWYQATEHVWKFVPRFGGLLKMTFYLLGGDNTVLETPLDIKIDAIGAKLLAIDRKTNPEKITLTLDVSQPFSVEFTSQSASARLVDAIFIHQLAHLTTQFEGQD